MYTTNLFFYLAVLNDLNNRRGIKRSCYKAFQLFWISDNTNNIFLLNSKFKNVEFPEFNLQIYKCTCKHCNVTCICDTVLCNDKYERRHAIILKFSSKDLSCVLQRNLRRSNCMNTGIYHPIATNNLLKYHRNVKERG